MVRKLGEEVELEPEEVEAYLSDISDGDDKEPDGWWFQEQGFVHPKGEKAVGLNHAIKSHSAILLPLACFQSNF